jgi:heme exporter protein CcmD
MSAIPHIGYIVAAYAIAAVAVAVMIGAILVDYYDLTKKIAELEAHRGDGQTPSR